MVKKKEEKGMDRHTRNSDSGHIFLKDSAVAGNDRD